MKTSFLITILVVASAAPSWAEPLQQGTFTDIVRTVEVLDQPTKNASPASLNELVKAPNLVRTGVGSRAELTAPDQTLTRIGANTVFSFAPSGREINLEQGSVLFHTPSGRGGGTIRSGGASAAVSGTTLICTTTPVTSPGVKNGFKVILLEGTGHVTLPSGSSRTLHAGQMVYILPNSSSFGPLLTINLSRLVGASALVHGFSHPLPSMPLIEIAIQAQQAALAKGELTDTGTPADRILNYPPPVGNSGETGPGKGDPNIHQIGVSFPPIQTFNNTPPNPNGLPVPPSTGGPSLYPPPPPPPRPTFAP